MLLMRLVVVSYLQQPLQPSRCIVLALIAGFFYGITLVPVFWLAERAEQSNLAASSGLFYIFSHFLGVFICSTFIFAAYSGLRRNKPFINSQTALPAILCGGIWAVAMGSLIRANDLLGQTFTWPLTTTIPGIVAACWSLFYFKEINVSLQRSL